MTGSLKVAGRLKARRHWCKQPHAGRRLSAHYLTGGSVERRCILEKKGRLSADEIPDVPGGSSRASSRLGFFLLSFFAEGPGWTASAGSLQVQAQGAAKFLAARANLSMIWLLTHSSGGHWVLLGFFCACQIYYLKAQKLKSNWAWARGCKIMWYCEVEVSRLHSASESLTSKQVCTRYHTVKVTDCQNTL